jgi:hypothetical protein
MSRGHRKGLPAREAEVKAVAEILWRCCWSPGDLNWWIGSLFAWGALLFATGGVLSLSPTLANHLSFSAVEVNAVFFLGSLPFTSAAYLQLHQSANAPQLRAKASQESRRRLVVGWFPRDLGWLSSALQFAGTLLFNVSTFAAMISSLTWLRQDLIIWAPDFIGSILFLASGYLAFVETCHANWAWKPASISWWVTFINLLGCIGFMVAAVFAVILPKPIPLDIETIAVAFTLQGAICFFLGSCLMLLEAQVGIEE